jgi:hypothetical protein
LGTETPANPPWVRTERAVVVFCFNMFGDALCDPRLRDGEGNMGAAESVMPQRICLSINSAALSIFLTASEK